MRKKEQDYNMFDWWKKVMIDNYANFSGRARRAEYWYFKLFNAFIVFGLWMSFLTLVIGYENRTAGVFILGFIFLYTLATILPSLAVMARRLHDVNKSGWTYLIAFVPFGIFVLLYYSVLDGDRRRNDYGEDPKMPLGRNDIYKIGIE
ncbi:DUF805 domain-containing protein [Flavobacterium cerinum]|uniref:DUF805 domain-containing protein n=1 Tax=Flavobacterium cerinum TaxID=2502784 RepID=A0ABY5ISD3_9FLAO|nr:DUF805 domain-containing protein [Flavobacterium cerinum]UUC44284.1 DUF805 domain-containing protein [Flavobacterium cerinum]